MVEGVAALAVVSVVAVVIPKAASSTARSEVNNSRAPLKNMPRLLSRHRPLLVLSAAVSVSVSADFVSVIQGVSVSMGPLGATAGPGYGAARAPSTVQSLPTCRTTSLITFPCGGVALLRCCSADGAKVRAGVGTEGT